MDTLVGLGNHGLHAQQAGTFRSPVTAGAGAVFLAGNDHQGGVLFLILHGRIVDRHLLASGDVFGESTLNAVQHLVPDAHVGEGATHHHLVIAPARTVRVEILRLHTPLLQVFTRRAVGFERPGRRNMVGGDGVTQQRQNVRVLDIIDGVRLFLQALEERRVLDVGGLVGPLVHLALGDLDRLPGGIAVEDFRILLMEHVGFHLLDRFGDFLLARPQVLQVHRLPVFVFAQRILGKVQAHVACQGIGHYQRW